MNIAEIESSLKDLVSKPFDAASFPFDFMAVFDAPKSTITKLRQAQPADLLCGPPEVHWKRKFLFQPAATGEVAQTLDAMRAREGRRRQWRSAGVSAIVAVGTSGNCRCFWCTSSRDWGARKPRLCGGVVRQRATWLGGPQRGLFHANLKY